MVSSSTGDVKNAKDKLNKKLPETQLAQLPPHQYAIIKIILDKTPGESAYADICTQMKADGLSQAEIDLSLHQLVQGGYISSFFDNGVFKYMATLDKEGRPSGGDHERLWDNFQFGLDQIDINLDD